MPTDMLSDLHASLCKLRQQPDNLKNILNFLFDTNNSLTTASRVGFAHRRFEMYVSPSNRNAYYMELPNSMATDIAAVIADQPALLIDCCLALQKNFSYNHLKELYTYHDNLRKTLEASDNPEVKVLLSLVAFKLQASSVLNREVFEAALHECPDRLKMFVVRDYANAYTSHAQCYTERYDPELHEALVNATQLYLPELSDQLMWLQRTKPQTYSDQIKEAMTSTSAILSTAQSFAGPLATYATNLFAGSGTNALQPSQAASDNVSSGLRRSNDK